MKEIDLKQSILKCSLINKAYALDEGLKLKYLNINHSNVVKYYESYILNNNETIYWIMEYCDGGTLRDKINIYCKNEIKIQENLIWYWSLQILSALNYLHSKMLIHRDLKPDNIYIENKTGSCKIGDFGLSKVLTGLPINNNILVKVTKVENEQYLDLDIKEEEEEESKHFYKLIQLSQVGTPGDFIFLFSIFQKFNLYIIL
jgi:serine/threonine protein kinase